MIIALDHGERYIGVATTDDEGRLSLRHSTIDQKKDEALPAVKKIVEENEVKKILVGVPVSLEGEDTDQTHVALAFIEELRGEFPDITVEGADETLTSAEAMANIKLQGGNEKEEHEESARIILESYLKSQMGDF